MRSLRYFQTEMQRIAHHSPRLDPTIEYVGNIPLIGLNGYARQKALGVAANNACRYLCSPHNGRSALVRMPRHSRREWSCAGNMAFGLEETFCRVYPRDPILFFAAEAL